MTYHEKLISSQSLVSDLPSHAVRSRRYFGGPSEKVDIEFVGTLSECKEYILDDRADVYHTSYNESGRWTLTIVRTNQLRPYALLSAKSKFREQSSR